MGNCLGLLDNCVLRSSDHYTFRRARAKRGGEAPDRGEVEDWIGRFKYPRRGWRGLDPAPLGVIRQLALEPRAH